MFCMGCFQLKLLSQCRWNMVYEPSILSGHYICDGVDPDVRQVDPTDRWFTYNDDVVSETCGPFVFKLREKYAYILFYQRQVGRD